MLKYAQACDTSGSKQSQCKAYLSAVVAYFYAGQGVDAQATYTVGRCSFTPASPQRDTT